MADETGLIVTYQQDSKQQRGRLGRNGGDVNELELEHKDDLKDMISGGPRGAQRHSTDHTVGLGRARRGPRPWCCTQPDPDRRLGRLTHYQTHIYPATYVDGRLRPAGATTPPWSTRPAYLYTKRRAPELTDGS